MTIVLREMYAVYVGQICCVSGCVEYTVPYCCLFVVQMFACCMYSCRCVCCPRTALFKMLNPVSSLSAVVAQVYVSGENASTEVGRLWPERCLVRALGRQDAPSTTPSPSGTPTTPHVQPGQCMPINAAMTLPYAFTWRF